MRFYQYAKLKPLFNSILTCLVFTMLCLLISCGKKGPVIPPLEYSPSEVEEASWLRNEQGAVVLSWTKPVREGGENPYDVIEYYEVARALSSTVIEDEGDEEVYSIIGKVVPVGSEIVNFTDNFNLQEKRYIYRIRAYTTSGLKGKPHYQAVDLRNINKLIPQ